jgi:hypothetical protein
VATFVPKAHTPFQWSGQISPEDLKRRQEILKNGLSVRGVKLSWHDPAVSLLEAVLARGDRRLGAVIRRAWETGSTFDAWSDQFKIENWLAALEACGLDPAFYAYRERAEDEVLPWSHVDIGVSPEYLKREMQRSRDCMETGDCRTGACNACGLEAVCHRS